MGRCSVGCSDRMDMGRSRLFRRQVASEEGGADYRRLEWAEEHAGEGRAGRFGESDTFKEDGILVPGHTDT